jgi:hypothetical protein
MAAKKKTKKSNIKPAQGHFISLNFSLAFITSPSPTLLFFVASISFSPVMIKEEEKENKHRRIKELISCVVKVTASHDIG